MLSTLSTHLRRLVRRRWPRRPVLVILAMAAALVAAPPAYAQGEAVTVTSHSHDSGGQTPAAVVCPPHDGLPGVALNALNQHGLDPADTYRGTSNITVCTYALADGSLFVSGEATDQVTITGCGTGALSYTFSGPVSAPDPVTLHRTSFISWTVIPGSGTGDLAGVTGTATLIGDIGPLLTEDGLFTGTLFC